MAYGIQDAILLMRTLPVDESVELVVSVIKKTLESRQVGVPDLIEDATQLPGQMPPKKQLPSIMFDGERWITVDIETGY